MIRFNLGDIGLTSESSSGEFLSGIGSEQSGSVFVEDWNMSGFRGFQPKLGEPPSFSGDENKYEAWIL